MKKLVNTKTSIGYYLSDDEILDVLCGTSFLPQVNVAGLQKVERTRQGGEYRTLITFEQFVTEPAEEIEL